MLAEDNSADYTIAGDLAADVDTADDESSANEAADDDNTDVFYHNMADKSIEALVSLAKDLSDNAELLPKRNIMSSLCY